MGGKSSTPPAPDPNATAAAQNKYDQNNAVFNAALNRYDVNSPFGGLTWKRTGTDASGAPIYQQNISLTPQAQATLDQTQGNALGLAQTQGQLMQNARNGLAQPVNTSNLPGWASGVRDTGPGYAGPVAGGDLAGLANNARQASYDSQMSLLEPQFSQQRQQMQTQLANQGLAMDSEAYKNAMGNLDRQQDWTRTQAANNATLNGQQYENQLFNQGATNAGLQNTAQQGYFNQGLMNSQLQNAAQQGGLQQALTLHDQPLNEYNSMLTGTQIQAPQFQGTPTVMANPASYQNAVNSAYQGQLNAYQAQTGSQNAMTGGLFGLGAATAPYWSQWFSDRRLKSNIVRVGTHRLGIGIYEYDIFGKRQRGVMADEVQQVKPEAVSAHPSGFKMVNYGAL
jgi:hypothetical protein